jgi:hypothetical protein
VDIIHSAGMPWGENLAAHRQGGMAHKLLFEGEEGRPDNYVLVLANEKCDYYSPRHRHAWDQVRFCLEGAIPIGKDRALHAGEVGYFPEGVPYGPQAGGPDRIVLLLQFGGASGLGYLSARQLREARQALASEGVFEGGVFRRTSGDGQKNLDAYEALWRHVTGRPIDYPRSGYDAPVVIQPDSLAWREIEGAPGVRRKALGHFPERRLSLDLIDLQPGSEHVEAISAALRLVFVRGGEGRCDGAPYHAGSAIRLAPGEAAVFAAAAPTELFVITVPPMEPPHA